jgi:peptidyl-prolyl cis-trans isomerase D
MQAAIIDEAHRMGLKVTDEELKEELRTGPLGRQLFPNGQYIGNERYERFVQSNGMDKKNFETLIKKQILFGKLQNVITGGVTVSDKDVQDAYQRQNVKVKFDYAVLTTADLMKHVLVTEPELRAYYEKNKASLANTIPEQRKARYVAIEPSKLNVQITDADYKNAYEARKAEFEHKEELDVRHILVKTEQQAKDIKKQLDAGAKFDVLAKKYSEDPGSKDNGGLYNNIARGTFVKEFEDVAYAQPIGKVSDPVKSNFGYHLIKTEARRSAGTKSLEEVKPQLEANLKRTKQLGEADRIATEIANEAKSGGLAAAAAKRNLNVVTTDFFPRTASLPGVGSSQPFLDAVFSKAPNSPAEKVTTDQGAAVVEVVGVNPPGTPTFEQARAQLENQFRGERAGQMLAQKTQELADRARSYNDLKKAAKELGAMVKTSDMVAPTAQVAELGSLSEGPAQVAFNLQPGQISGALAVGQNGAVIKLLERQEPPVSDFAKQKDQIREQLLQSKRNQVLQLYAEQLRDRMLKDGRIKINGDEQQRLFNTSGS